jgi:hypothetical protein
VKVKFLILPTVLCSITRDSDRTPRNAVLPEMEMLAMVKDPRFDVLSDCNVLPVILFQRCSFFVVPFSFLWCLFQLTPET